MDPWESRFLREEDYSLFNISSDSYWNLIDPDLVELDLNYQNNFFMTSNNFGKEELQKYSIFYQPEIKLESEYPNQSFNNNTNQEESERILLLNATNSSPKNEFDPNKNIEDCLHLFQSSDWGNQQLKDFQNICEINSEQVDDQLNSKKRGPRKMKFNRWRKEDDKILFQTIQKLIDNASISSNFLENIEKEITEDSFNELFIVKNAVNWKNSIEDLKKRIQRLRTSSELSVREIAKLKKVLKSKFKNKDIDVKVLMDEFPGKSKKYLMDIWDKIRRKN